MTPPLVLASQSPRRADLLVMLGLTFEVDAATIVEDVLEGEDPNTHVLRLAAEKARVVAARRPDALVIAGDTVVIRDDEILGKPRDADDAVAMLTSLAGRHHEVVSALALAEPSGRVHSGVSRTVVRFRAFDHDEARSYVATGEPMDKAGAYGIQGLGAVLVDSVEGDFFTVMGLPLPLLVRMLRDAGVPYTFDARGDRGSDAEGLDASARASSIFTAPRTKRVMTP